MYVAGNCKSKDKGTEREEEGRAIEAAFRT